jgi:hypothetical protein
MSNQNPEPSDLIPDEFELGRVGNDDPFASAPMDALESELMALVNILGDELNLPTSSVPETWQLADRSPHLNGRPFRYKEFYSIVMPLNTGHLQVKILNG